MKHFDVLIVGSGLVGASAGCALAQHDLRIGIIDNKNFSPSSSQKPLDHRAIALSYDSRVFFESMDLWCALEKNATPIHHIHVSDKGSFGMARLSCEKTNHEALGYTLEAHTLNQMLHERLKKNNRIECMMPVEIKSLVTTNEGHTLLLSTHEGEVKITASFIIAADGVHSSLRTAMKLPVTQWPYDQTAITATLLLKRDHHFTAYERFTPSGPLALLPLSQRYCGLVWTVTSEELPAFQALDDTTFLQHLQKYFGYRLGRFLEIGKRYYHPLTAVLTEQQVCNGIVFIGNAAHTLHPVAGQGLNLGLRDVATLTTVIQESFYRHQRLNDPVVMQAYESHRLADQRKTLKFTDGLVRLFSNDTRPLSLVRNLGLTGFEFLPPLKRIFSNALSHADV